MTTQTRTAIATAMRHYAQGLIDFDTFHHRIGAAIAKATGGQP